MQKLIPSLKRHSLSWCCIALIWILSLTPIFPETPFDDVAFIDKWSLDYEKLFFYAFLLPILMSGLLELLQEYCTGGHRNGDWLDFAANSLGVLLGNLLGWLLHHFFHFSVSK